MLKINIKKLHENAVLPAYQTDQAAAMDLVACIDQPKTLQPMERAIIPTGFAMELPAGYEAQIRPRSGLAIKHGIAMANGVGTIDADYRGEVCALVINLGTEAFTIENGMRIAQMVIARHEVVSWQLDEALNETNRGDGKFGSTGMNI